MSTMPEYTTTLCESCKRTIFYSEGKKRWVHDDTRSVWCSSGMSFAAPFAAKRSPRIMEASELIGIEGQFRIPGGRAIYDAVMWNGATARSDRVRLCRLDVTSRGGVRQINRWIAWDAPIEVLSIEGDES